jgi:hypothetical protein
MSEHVIMGSFKLWIDLQKRNDHDHRREEEAEELVLTTQVNIEEIENDVENVDNILNMEMNETVELETNSPIALGLQLMDSTVNSQHETKNDPPVNLELSL